MAGASNTYMNRHHFIHSAFDFKQAYLNISLNDKQAVLLLKSLYYIVKILSIFW